MRNAIAGLLLGIAGLLWLYAFTTHAQNRSEELRESTLRVNSAVVDFFPDGGCALTARGSIIPVGPEGIVIGVTKRRRYESDPWPFDGPRCDTMLRMSERLLKRTIGVGDGGSPDAPSLR